MRAKMFILLSIFISFYIRGESGMPVTPTGDQSYIKLLILSNKYEEGKKLVEALCDPNSSDYYYLMGFLMEDKTAYEEANGYYIHAYELKKTEENAFGIVRTYIELGKFEDALDFLNDLEKRYMNKEEIKSLRETLEKAEKAMEFKEVSLGIGYRDNLYEDESKVGTFGHQIEFDYGKVLNYKNYMKLKNYFVYVNEDYYEGTERDYHYFYLNSTLEKDNHKNQITFPLEANFKLRDNKQEEYNIGLGAGYKKKLADRYNMELSTQIAYKNNKKENYTGYVNTNKLVTKFQEPFGIDYTICGSIDLKNYDNKDYDKKAYGSYIILKKGIGANIYSLKLKGAYIIYNNLDRTDLEEEYIFLYKRIISKDGWSATLRYTYEAQDSTDVNYEFADNQIALLISKEF